MPFYAERRQITVLFCDLIGSTPLSTRLDPEDLRNVISGYQVAVGAAVTGLCGYVARFQGDGVLAYFGWPNADEAHAETAVRAALDIVESVAPSSFRFGSALPRVLSLLGIWSASAQRRNVRLSARPPISPRDCKQWPNRMRSW